MRNTSSEIFAPKKICVFTSTRADYGLWHHTLRALLKAPDFELAVLVTGTHLSREHGRTVEEIRSDGIPIAKEVDMLLSSDNQLAIAKSMGLALMGYAEALTDLAPDVLLVLGDRYETLCAATAATICGIPIAHCHGGEKSEGAFDEAFRHAVTKMSHLHFVATEKYRERVVQLGEQPSRVVVTGALGLENITNGEFLTKAELEENLKIGLGSRYFVITFHPVTLEQETSVAQFQELLNALSKYFPDFKAVFTLPNADTESGKIADLIKAYCGRNSNAFWFPSLGWKRYLSAAKHSHGVIGNSSSGIIEAPSLGVGTVNIGDRQKGRDAGMSVLHCSPEEKCIANAITRLLAPEFRSRLANFTNPYHGPEKPSSLILKTLRIFTPKSLKKTFYDLPRKLAIDV